MCPAVVKIFQAERMSDPQSLAPCDASLNKLLYTSVSAPEKAIRLDSGFWSTFCGTLRTQGPLQRVRAGLRYIGMVALRDPGACFILIPILGEHINLYLKRDPFFLLFLFLVPQAPQTSCPKLNSVLSSLLHQITIPLSQRSMGHPWWENSIHPNSSLFLTRYPP